MNSEIIAALCEKGAEIVRFVDISHIPKEQRQSFPRAIVFCLPIDKDFILALRDGIKSDRGNDDFVIKEHRADDIADWLAGYIVKRGYGACSQSEEGNVKNDRFIRDARSSLLPHKTIARLAGLGFIGKSNLFINGVYGSGFCMCTVLTDAPLETDNPTLIPSQCGNCMVCRDVCPTGAIYGIEWTESGGRDAIIDVSKCKCTLKCMVNCPHTLKYALS